MSQQPTDICVAVGQSQIDHNQTLLTIEERQQDLAPVWTAGPRPIAE